MDNAKVISQVAKERIPLASRVPLDTPLVIYVEVSSFCNLACTFCPHYIAPDRLHKQNMSLDIFKKLVDDSLHFDNRLKLLRICGTGDATLNKELPAMVQYANSRNVSEKFEMITNGILLKEPTITILTDSLSRIIVSIEGLTDEDYEYFTNRKVNYNTVVKNVKQLYENKNDCTIHVKIHNSAVPTKEKQDKFFDTFGSFCDEIYIENLVDLWPDTDSSLGNDPVQRFSGGVPREVLVCSQIFKTMQVNSDGRVMPCSIDWEAKNIIGDITKQSLKDIWNGEEMKEIRLKHLLGKRFNFLPCKNCSFNEYSDVDDLDSEASMILDRIGIS